jgi:DNA-binding PadR family transcriptional regulator
MGYTGVDGLGIWELAVLSFLRERPMHPYEIQTLLKERHKDDVLVLKRGSLYHAIERLEKALLIEAGETSRNGRRPERTTYRITDAGTRALVERLERLIGVPERERSEFLGAVSFLVHLTPSDAAAHLYRRIELLEREIAERDAMVARACERLERIHLVESEYAQTLRKAELEWVRGLLQDLSSGRLWWDVEAVLKSARESAPK